MADNGEDTQVIGAAVVVTPSGYYHLCTCWAPTRRYQCLARELRAAPKDHHEQHVRSDDFSRRHVSRPGRERSRGARPARDQESQRRKSAPEAVPQSPAERRHRARPHRADRRTDRRRQRLQEYYCPTVLWDWADGTESESTFDCEPYEAGKSEIKRRYTVQHTFRAGAHKVWVRLKRNDKLLASANVSIQIQAGRGVEDDR